MTENALYTLWLILAGKQGSTRAHRLICTMKAKEAFDAGPEDLILHIGKKDAEYFINKDLSSAQRVLETCQKKGIDIVCYQDEHYPAVLREIQDPPPALFYYGKLPDPKAPTVGIVGTRKCSPAAAGIAATFSCSLALSGVQTISGMAEGIDTYAHKGALIKGRPSYAILGCGVDVIYPKSNETLYTLLKEHGGLISEFLPGTPPLASNFPRRNRIISGLSDGVLVVECPPKSGSMITARCAIEQNRILFAVPAAPTDKVNTGTNQLIKHGAVFCTEPNDIFNELHPRYANQIKPTVVRLEQVGDSSVSSPTREREPTKRKISEISPSSGHPKGLSPEETTVYQAFSGDAPLSADELCQRTGIPFHRLLPILQGLELSGHLQSLPGALFCRK